MKGGIEGAVEEKGAAAGEVGEEGEEGARERAALVGDEAMAEGKEEGGRRSEGVREWRKVGAEVGI